MHFSAILKHYLSKILNDLKYDDRKFVDEKFQIDSGLLQIQIQMTNLIICPILCNPI